MPSGLLHGVPSLVEEGATSCHETLAGSGRSAKLFGMLMGELLSGPARKSSASTPMAHESSTS